MSESIRLVGPSQAVDRMAREILERFHEAEIGVASATVQIVGLPPLRLDAGAQADTHR